jgi:hypothetical protein
MNIAQVEDDWTQFFCDDEYPKEVFDIVLTDGRQVEAVWLVRGHFFPLLGRLKIVGKIRRTKVRRIRRTIVNIWQQQTEPAL